MFLVGVQINISEIHIAEFAGRHFAQLLFNAAAALDGVFKNFAGFVLAHDFIGENQLGKTRKGSSHSNCVSGVKLIIQSKILAK